MARNSGKNAASAALVFVIVFGLSGLGTTAERWRPGMEKANGRGTLIPTPTPEAVAADEACASLAGVEEIPWQCLQGVFHVIAHYHDTSGIGSPETKHWKDWGWQIEAYQAARKKGQIGHVRWSVFPEVKLVNTDGQFNAGHGSSGGREFAFWVPNAAQREELEAGVPVVQHLGPKKNLKPMRKNRCRWQSKQQKRIVDTRTVGYQKVLGIYCDGEALVFEISDTLGGGYHASMGNKGEAGLTAFRVDALEIVQDLQARPTLRMTGVYSRDGTQQGTFIATRIWAGLGGTEDAMDARMQERREQSQRDAREVWEKSSDLDPKLP